MGDIEKLWTMPDLDESISAAYADLCSTGKCSSSISPGGGAPEIQPNGFKPYRRPDSAGAMLIGSKNFLDDSLVSSNSSGLSFEVEPATATQSLVPIPSVNMTPEQQSHPRNPPAGMTLATLYEMYLGICEHVQYLESCLQAQQAKTGFLDINPAVTPVSSRASQTPTLNARSTVVSSNLIKMRDLDGCLYLFFRSCPVPDPDQLAAVCSQLEPTFPHLDRKHILSSVRKWFRKRRDENGQQVFQACDNLLRGRLAEGSLTVEAVREDCRAHGALFRGVCREAALEIGNVDALNKFVGEKIESYLSRRITGSRKRQRSIEPLTDEDDCTHQQE